MSEICLGTMWFGTRTDEETSFELLDRSIEAGGGGTRPGPRVDGPPTGLQASSGRGSAAATSGSPETTRSPTRPRRGRAEPAIGCGLQPGPRQDGTSASRRTALDRPAPPARLARLHAVAEEAGATPNQVVIAWLLAHDVVPVVGVSSLAQLEETLAARDLKLDEPAVRRLDGVTGL